MRFVLLMAVGAALGLLLALCIGGVVGVAVLLSGPSAPLGAAVEPSQKAAMLARSISEGMNTAAFTALLLVPAGAFGGWRRGRSRPERPDQ
jgi:hypothetical protein